MNIAQHEMACFQAHRAIAWKERIEIANSRREKMPHAEVERRIQLLRRAVEVHGGTQGDVADLLGVKKGAVSSWAGGRYVVPGKHLAKLEKLAGGGK